MTHTSGEASILPTFLQVQLAPDAQLREPRGRGQEDEPPAALSGAERQHRARGDDPRLQGRRRPATPELFVVGSLANVQTRGILGKSFDPEKFSFG